MPASRRSILSLLNTTIMRANFLLLFYLSIPFFLLAQGENNIWYLGEDFGIDFNGDHARAISDGKIPPLSGIGTTACDKNGNLLFYTNGLTVWDRNHQVMPNGSDLEGYRVLSSAIIIPYPEHPSLYYLFTFTPIVNGTQAYYSIIDMNLNNGLGDVILSQKNIRLTDNVTLLFATAPGSCGSLWLVTHGYKNYHFIAYNITGNGIDTKPVISNVGSYLRDIEGRLKFNNIYNRLLLHSSSGLVEIYDFDQNTGQISNPFTYSPALIDKSEFVSASFSPDGSKFFVSLYNSNIGSFEIRQHHYPPVDTNNFFNNYQSLFLDYPITDMQNGPNGQLYIRFNVRYIGVITQPNVIDFASSYVDSVFQTPGTILSYLPNLVVTTNPPFDSTYQVPDQMAFCTGEALKISLNPNADYIWQDNTTDFEYTITHPGIYTYLANKGKCIFYDTIEVLERQYPTINLGKDTLLCIDQSLILSLPMADTIVWDDGSSNTSRSFNEPGTYWVHASNGKCESRDTFTIKYHECNCDLYVPNVFSPNGDGNNDVFQIFSTCDLVYFSISIYNRWGEEVFYSRQLSDSWTGDSHKIPGVYIYHIQYRTLPNNPLQKLAGSITLFL